MRVQDFSKDGLRHDAEGLPEIGSASGYGPRADRGERNPGGDRFMDKDGWLRGQAQSPSSAGRPCGSTEHGTRKNSRSARVISNAWTSSDGRFHPFLKEKKTMKIIVWNTGRQYTEHGQRIAAAQVGDTVYFVDIDRHIEGCYRVKKP